ncbi:MAG: hypothetical protein EA425_08085 [Puniceicoccaceae bacterium]|nr:MAG: hypothetical protein EA425_08085 [Puniceicoccaceae bacterium]
MNPLHDPHRRRGGILLKVLFLAVFLLALGVLGWILLLPTLATREIQKRSGFPASVQALACNPFGGTLTLRDLRIENPEAFPTRDFVALASLDLKVRPTSLMGERVVIPRMVIDLEKVTLVTAPDGSTNVEVFRRALHPEPDRAPGDEPAEDPELPEFLIEHLHLRIGSIEMIDHRRDRPRLQRFELGIDRQFTDVTDPKEIIGPLSADLAAAGIAQVLGGLLGILPGNLADIMQTGLSGSGDFLRETGDRVGRTLKNLFDSLRQEDED